MQFHDMIVVARNFIGGEFLSVRSFLTAKAGLNSDVECSGGSSSVIVILVRSGNTGTYTKVQLVLVLKVLQILKTT